MSNTKLKLLVCWDLLRDSKIRLMIWVMIAPFIVFASLIVFFTGYWTHDVNLVGVAYFLLTCGMMPYLIIFQRIKGRNR